MAHGITYSRRIDGRIVRSPKIGEIFSNWQPAQERWLFLSAHDDDIVVGAGLTFQAAIAEGVEVHAVITTDGRMGYCRLSQRQIISEVRRKEAEASFQLLQLPLERLHFLGFPDCNLNPYRGRRLTTEGDPTEIEGASGLQNAFPYMLRKIRPTRIFVPTITDLHPDHRIVNQEMLISLFHAQGKIWPELGEPLEQVPAVYDYATYCDFPEPPQIRLDTPAALLETKLQAIRAYASQEQIDMVVDVQREVGPIEYIREIAFNFYSPKQYHHLFTRGS